MEPATGPYPEPYESSAELLLCYSKIHPNIIFPSTSRS
jgi:hypothetical protein